MYVADEHRVNDELVARAMDKFGLPSKRSAVELALERLVGPPLTGPALTAFLSEIEGTGWDADPAVREERV